MHVHHKAPPTDDIHYQYVQKHIFQFKQQVVYYVTQVGCEIYHGAHLDIGVGWMTFI